MLEMRALRFFSLSIICLVLLVISDLGRARDFSPSPAPAPTSDGTAVDQGIAYILMLVALAITYMLH